MSRLKPESKLSVPKPYADQLREWKERRKKIVQMHDRQRHPMTFLEIGEELGITPQRAHQLYNEAKKAGE